MTERALAEASHFDNIGRDDTWKKELADVAKYFATAGFTC
jgi:hypothetical protein